MAVWELFLAITVGEKKGGGVVLEDGGAGQVEEMGFCLFSRFFMFLNMKSRTIISSS